MWWIIWILFVMLGSAFIVSLRAALRMERDRDRWRRKAEWLVGQFSKAGWPYDATKEQWLQAADEATGGDA